MKTRPAAACLLCNRPLAVVGGSRILGRSYVGIRFAPKPETGSQKRSIAVSQSDSEQFMVVWGQIWTEDLIRRARQLFNQGQHPWFCQECVGPRCYNCGHVTAFPVASTTIDEDGTIRTFPGLPTPQICSNPNCVNYYKR